MPRPIITIPKPCHENWAAMTPTGPGRHCASCDKVVVDFTRMTDAEVVAWLQRPTAFACGRFRADQLQRPLATPETASHWRLWLAAAAAVLGLRTVAAPAVRGQQKPAVEQLPVTLGMVTAPKLPQPMSMPPLVVRGVVLDSASREPLPGVTVLVKGTTSGVSTNADGTFELVLPEEVQGTSTVELQISSIGYIAQQYLVDPRHTDSLSINMTTQTLGELIVCRITPWYTPRGLWQRLTRPFRQ